MPAANHSYYLRNCYLDNNLVKGTLTIDNVAIELRRITIPVYNLATREDHIAPAKSVYQYWTGDAPHGDDLNAWLRSATMHPGSWWSDWLSWLKAQDAEEVAAREPGGGKFVPIEDAPGSYVKVRS